MLRLGALIRTSALLSVVCLASGCSSVSETTEAGSALAFAPTPAKYTWMLPKTLINVTVTYTVVDCDDAQRKLTVSPTLAISGVGAPDLNLGPDYPDGVISVTPEDYTSFWSDNNISIKTSSTTHILTYIGSQPTSQVGQIIGNVVGTVSKFAAIGLGVNAAGAALPYCGPIKGILQKIKVLQDQLVDPNATPEQTKNNAGQITSLQTALSISAQAQFDPGAKPLKIDSKTRNVFIGSVRPTLRQLQESKWFHDAATAAEAFGKSRALRVDVFMALDQGVPFGAMEMAVQCADKEHCVLSRVDVPKGSIFREVAYIPVLAYHESQTGPVIKKTLPFGQFGVPRKLPLTAGAFQQLTWALTFSDTGELSESTFTSKASGVPLTSLFSTAESRNAAVAMDPDTTRLQNENTALKAQIDNLNYMQQLKTLTANGGH
jgi:hypothetical protein